MSSDLETRIRNVTAVLGPTNTGKTHLAIERMLGHDTGMIGLPLRLLAREVYDKIAARVGATKVALITGEEKIKPERAKYWVSTVEAMPLDIDVDFLAIDEIQLCGDPERGHVFTDRLLHARGRTETLLLGAQTMRDAIQELIPGANFISRPRLSQLTYAGEKKITRLPTRTAVVAFSANEVYAIAELIRRQRGGAAVVLGALSPRTRNAQVALYQSGDVDFLVATDAVGMGLNLDVDHVAFSALRKFDGQTFRNLTPSEVAQIAGRAGRHMNDGTFGVTGNAEPFEEDLIERLEQHTFDPVRTLQWRNRRLDFSSLDRLRDSLRRVPNEQRLTRARMSDDVTALETVSADKEILDFAATPAAVSRLWDVCQVPDYRKISSQNHAELVSTLYKFLMTDDGRIPEDWFAKQVDLSDRTDGDIDTLANRISHIRTWTFVSNRSEWLKDPEHWQARTRQIEDSLSDALHECLTQRFVDRRTSALMKGLRDKEELSAEISEDGSVRVENHYVGRLTGFRFSPESQSEDVHGKAARHAAAQVVSRELGMRARRVAAAKADAFSLSGSGRILWRGEEVAYLEAGEDPLKPRLEILADEHLSGPDAEKVRARLETWRDEAISERLKPLVELSAAEDVNGLARGIAFRLQENFGVLKRETLASVIKDLDQKARAELRKYGVRFGAFNIYFPILLKPAAAELLTVLWTLKHASDHNLTLDAMPELPRAGLTSASANPSAPEALYRAYGFHVCGPRVIRLDILERLADLIRPLLAWRSNSEKSEAPPNGSTGDGGFTVTPDMMSILGCSQDELGSVLQALGFRLDRRRADQVKTATPPVPSSPVSTEPNGPAPSPGTASSEGNTEEGSTPLEGASSEAASSEQPPRATDSAGGTDEPSSTPTTNKATDGESEISTAAEDAEPAMIEIWRPRRHQREDRQRPQRNRGRRNSAPQDGETSSDDAPARAAKKRNAGDRSHGSGRPDQKSGHRARRDRDGDQNRGKRPGGKKHRNDQRRDRATVHSAAPPKAPRKGKAGPDPDSPFASLGALKDALEKQTRDKEQ